MPELPASGVWHVRDYSGMGGVHWRPPFDSLEVMAAGKSWSMKSPAGSCQSAVTVISAGVYGGTYSIGSESGSFEVQPQADGSLKVEFLNQPFTSYGNSRSRGVIVSAEKGSPTIHTGSPTLADKTGFFPSVLGNHEFRQNGILFGEDPTIARDAKWMVLDPNRHKLAIWEKPSPTSKFPAAGQSLSASVFTNGPMLYNALGRPAGAMDGVRYVLDGSFRSAASMIPFVQGPSGGDTWNQAWTKAAADQYGSTPCGDVIGTSACIKAVAPPPGTNRFGYFGRGSRTDFASYKIGQGNPIGLVEATGGLYPPAVLNGVFTPDGFGGNQWLYWGLAPLPSDAADKAGFKAAIAGYESAMKIYGKSVSSPTTGLIIAFAYNGNGSVIQCLVDAGITDAVKVDGNDSVLFGYGSTLLWGSAMTDRKQTWLNWGFAFKPY